MKIRFLLFALLSAAAVSHPLPCPAAPPEAAIQIIMAQPEVSLPQMVQSDIERLLQQATGLTTVFTRKEGGKAEYKIYLRLFPLIGPGGNAEYFTISSPNDKTQDIKAATTDGLQAACYSWLEHLGFYFLLPGEDWTIIPKLQSPILKLPIDASPAFKERIIFSTYGQMPPAQMGLSYDIRDDWNLWQMRRHLGGSLHIETGHYGAIFNRKHKEILSQHPEYRPEIKGKRKPYSDQMKLNFANEEVIQLYIQDALDRLEKNPSLRFVNIEPSDGEGWCTCAECRKMGSVSNVVFNLANRVAEAIDKKYPGAMVYLLAYAGHAATPDFALKPNVFVMATPYWYQEVSSPEKFMADWAAKAAHKGLRVYWNMPTALDVDLPRFNMLEEGKSIIRLANENKYEAFVCQSSFGAGSSGFLQYLASKLLWNPDEEPKAVVDGFCQQAFGKAASAPMTKLFTLWNTRFNVDTDLPLVYQYLVEAAQLTQDPAVQKRLDDLKIYAHYLRLLADYRKNESDDAARKALIDYAWAVNHTRMVNAYLVSMHLMKKKNADLDETSFGKTFRKNGGSGEVKSLTRAVAVALFEKEKSAVQSTPAAAARRSAEKPPATPDAIAAWTPLSDLLPGLEAAQPDLSWRFNADATFKALVKKGKPLEINLSVIPTGAKSICTVSIADQNSRVVFEKTLGKEGETDQALKPELEPGLYTVNVRAKLCKVALQNPALPFVSTRPIRAGGFAEMTRYYFVLPANRKAFSIRFQQKTKHTSVWVGGKKLRDVATGDSPEVINCYADPSAKIQVGYVETKSSLFEFIDLPHVLSLSPAQLLLP